MTGWDLLVIGGLAGAAIFVLFIRNASRQDRQAGERVRATSDEVLDDLFSGERVVTFKTHRNTLDFDTVVRGADLRGYELTSQANADQYGTVRDLVFEKR